MEVVQLAIGEAHDLGCAALLGIGFTSAEARSVVDHLIDNSLCGYRFAGLPRILALADSPEIRRPRTPITIEYETPVSARVDGGITSATSPWISASNWRLPRRATAASR